jgi:hypothetical protein
MISKDNAILQIMTSLINSKACNLSLVGVTALDIYEQYKTVINFSNIENEKTLEANFKFVLGDKVSVSQSSTYGIVQNQAHILDKKCTLEGMFVYKVRFVSFGQTEWCEEKYLKLTV